MKIWPLFLAIIAFIAGVLLPTVTSSIFKSQSRDADRDLSRQVSVRQLPITETEIQKQQMLSKQNLSLPEDSEAVSNIQSASENTERNKKAEEMISSKQLLKVLDAWTAQATELEARAFDRSFHTLSDYHEFYATQQGDQASFHHQQEIEAALLNEQGLPTANSELLLEIGCRIKICKVQAINTRSDHSRSLQQMMYDVLDIMPAHSRALYDPEQQSFFILLPPE